MKLFLKPKNFSHFFVKFLESTSTFKHFEKKNDRNNYFNTEFTGCERLG